MAIIKCPECGKEISSTAPVCPYCGYSRILAPQSKEKTRRNAIIFIVGAILAMLLSDWYYIAFVVGGLIIEVILSVIFAVSGMFFGGRRIMSIMDFFLFDLGVGLGTIIRLVLQLKACM